MGEYYLGIDLGGTNLKVGVFDNSLTQIGKISHPTHADMGPDAVINTITKGFPLNVMYWAVKDDGKYEIIDGQQRTISISQFVEGDFSIDFWVPLDGSKEVKIIWLSSMKYGKIEIRQEKNNWQHIRHIP